MLRDHHVKRDDEEDGGDDGQEPLSHDEQAYYSEHPKNTCVDEDRSGNVTKQTHNGTLPAACLSTRAKEPYELGIH
jgi:hypothetical protein